MSSAYNLTDIYLNLKRLHFKHFTMTSLTFLSSLNALIFGVISGLHVYWGFCALFGIKSENMTSVVPEIHGRPVFVPSAVSTFLVALVLGLAAFISLRSLTVFNENFTIFPVWIVYGNLVISVIFLIRAIGEFKYVGFFKKVKGTLFAKNDTLFYSPLCLLISIAALFIFLKIRN